MKSFSAGLLLLSVALLFTVQEVSGDFTEMWTATGEVPNKLAEAPPSPLYLYYSGGYVMPNDTVTTEQMLTWPKMAWQTEAGALYTIIFIDFGITRLGGLQYFHWLVSNVRDGYNINLGNGDEVKAYIPPFTYHVNEDGTLNLTVDGAPDHDILALVYKQKNGQVDMSDEKQSGCEGITDNRIGDHAALAKKYNLELVAGNFFFTTYTETCNIFLCYFSKCTGQPFPVPAPGINDGPECQPDFTEKWIATGEVPNKLAEAPPSPLSVSYSGENVMPNDTVTTEVMLTWPDLKWKTDSGALYTIVLIDFGITRLGGLQFYHWLVSNVRDGSSINMGDEVKAYIPPFTYHVNEDGTLNLTVDGTPDHDILALVYKQKNGQVDMSDEIQSGCEGITDKRIGDHVALAKKYNLELVAGNFFFTTYTEASNIFLCYFSKCTGQPFPVPAPGINDGPECQQ